MGVEQKLEAARIAQLYRSGRVAYLASPVYAAVLMLVLWGPITAGVLVAWFAVMLAVSVARALLHRFHAHGERIFAAGALAGGAAWSFVPVVLFPEASPSQQIAIVFVIGGSMIGAAGLYATSAKTFAGYSALPFALTLARLALVPDTTYRLMALMLVLFAGILLRVYRDMRAGVEAALRYGMENEDLARRLAASEARIRDAIESFPEGIAAFDAEERLVVCNEEYARVYGAGRAAEALRGAPYAEIAANAWEAEIVPPEFAGRREDWIQERVLEARSGAAVTRVYQTRDGRWKQGRFVKSRGGGGVGVFSDVTELKQAQERYLAVLAEESLVLDTLPVGVAFFEERRIVRCNRRMEQMLGYAPGELAGQSARVLYYREEAWKAAGAGYERLRGGGVVEGEFTLAKKDGGKLRCTMLTRAINPDSPHSSVIGAFADVSERHAAEVALRSSESMYRNLVETSNDLVWSLDAEGRWTYLSPSAVQRIYGCRAQDMLGARLREVLAPEVLERDSAVLERILGGETLFRYETRHVRRDGSIVDLALNAVPLRDASGAIVGATGTARDVSEEKAAAAALHESVEKLRLAVEAADLYYWEWDAASGEVQFGHTPGAGLGLPGGARLPWRDYVSYVHPEDRERYLAAGRASFERGEPYAVEYRVEGEGGRLRWFSARGKPLADATGRVYRMIGVSQDITERKRQDEEARFLAYHDSLTGLPNRRLLDDRLKQAVFLAQRRDTGVAVMLIDLDRFKQVNDTLGHRAGDAVLREVGHRLAACVRKADTLARHGGDEFVVVIPDLQTESDCQVVAEKVLHALETPFRVDGREFRIGASIGISLYPADAGDGEMLLRNADVAMYRAKQLGQNNYLFYRR